MEPEYTNRADKKEKNELNQNSLPQIVLKPLRRKANVYEIIN